jgi:ribosome-associated protein
MDFDLNGQEFIPLNRLLKLLNLVRSGGEANQRIEEGEVKVNDVVEKQKRKKLKAGDRVAFQKTMVNLR